MVKFSASHNSPHHLGRLWLLMPMLLCLGFSGCASVINPINAIPADRVPPQFLAEPQANKRPIDVSLLRHVAPPNYILDKDDILGVFVEGVLGTADEAPPVTIPDPLSDLSPGIGFPIPVREDGTISLPLIDPIAVRGLTVGQVEELVIKRYLEEELLVNPRVIVTLLRKRTYRIFVVRQDNTNARDPRVQASGRGTTSRSDLSSSGFLLNLPAYENDLLNALTQTGGLPGVNSKPEVTILRGDNQQTEARFQEMRELFAGRLPPNTPNPAFINEATSLTIPLRLAPNEIPNFRPEDVILRDGDVVYVESRETDVYYTGGLLNGGEWQIPRDYDLDVIGAIALAGQGLAITNRESNAFGGQFTKLPPTELVVLRPLPGNRQIAISIDLTRAINDPRSRILVHKGDTLILRYQAREEIINFALSVFFTYGLQRALRGR